MTPVRHLLLGLASSSALYSGVVPALGLGEITLHSALNQPLDAEIELLEVGDLTSGDVLVRLASPEVFSRSGVDRFFFLNDLRFTPVLRGANSVIRVVSNRPVNEPYLNFIVEVARPNGQLLREYTVLLDPPGSSSYRTMATMPQAQPESAPARQAAAEPAQTYVAPSVMPSAERGQRYQVSRGDSLWSIAAGLRAAGSELSQDRLMRDIHALNPQAFSNGDINRLQAGADLLLPDAANPQAAATPEAVAAVPEDAPLTPQQPLESPDEALAVAQRRIDQALADQALENQQLQQGLADLQAQLQQLQSQLADKDQQLTELQARLDAPAPVVEDTPAVVPAPATAEAPVATVDAPAVQERSWFSATLVFLLLVLAALVALYWRVRRRPAPVEPTPAKPEAVAVVAPAPVSPVVAAAPLVAAAPVAPAPAPVAPLRSAVPVDALEGANIYIAYGRFSEAAVALRKALDAQPHRSDIRFRLLEVYAQLGDAQAFAREEAILRKEGFTPARIDQLKARHPHLIDGAAAPALNDDLVLDDAPAPAPVSSELSDDFQLNLDDLSLDADWDLVSPFSPKSRAKAAPAAPEEPEHHDLGKHDVRSPFAASMLVEEHPSEDWLQSELDDNFLKQPDAADSLLLSDLDEHRDTLSKLNLALAYIEQGSLESACDILNEVIIEGDDAQKKQARELLAKIA